MKLLFWNINKKDNADLALTFMREEEIGVAAFAEFSGTDFSAELLKSSGYRPIGRGGCDKVKIIARDPIEILDCFEESRFTVLPMKIGEIYFVIAAAHLVDRMSSADPEPRLVDIRKMMDVIHGYETKASIGKTIIMGDLNAVSAGRF